MSGSRLQPALLGGAVIGVLSALPIVAWGNCCCCLWVVLGGFVAAYVAHGSAPGGITIAEGALVGFLAGIVGAVVASVMSLLLAPVIGPLMEGVLRQAEQNARNLPPEVRDAFESLRGRHGFAFGVLGAIAGLLIGLVVNAVFATLGGALGALLLRKPTPPAPPAAGQWTPPPPPPPAWTPPTLPPSPGAGSAPEV